MNRLWTWLDDRTGLAGLVHETLYERVPGGARWRYVWGSTLVFAFFVQAITGIVLWTAYSPSAQTAWESVYFIQYDMQGGWLLRGLHHFMAQAMVVLLAVHLMQVVIDGAYRAPREINFWLGLVLMQIVLALSLTGYLLPWDQKGYWATQVATKLMGVVPVVGAPLQKLVVGGTTYGHHTLTRFFALHAGVLPAALVMFLVLHVALFRRHGIHAHRPAAGPDTTFWPDQVLKDAVACLAVLVVVLLLIVWPGLTQGLGSGPLGEQLGADLGAPADGSRSYSAARPEWYFLFLFQFLKFFHGETQEFLGAVLVPSAVLGVIALMPVVGRWQLGHRFNIAFLLMLLGGVLLLTVSALREDNADPAYQQAVARAERQAERARQLASAPAGIPPAGAVTLLRSDPKTEGPILFEQHCASCHSFAPAEGPALIPVTDSSAGMNLAGFGRRAWIAGLLDPARVDSRDYFGATRHASGDMVAWVKDTLAEPDEAQRAALQSLVIALSAEGHFPDQAQQDAVDVARIEAGRKAALETFSCTDCHRWGDRGEEGTAPDLTGYGSAEWLRAFLAEPSAPRFYGHKADETTGAMPNFGLGQHPRLSPEQIGILADWLRGDWYEPATADAAGDESLSADPGSAAAD